MSRRRRRLTQEEMDLSRRDFLWKGACAALTATGIASTISDLRLVNAAVANSIRPRRRRRRLQGAGLHLPVRRERREQPADPDRRRPVLRPLRPVARRAGVAVPGRVQSQRRSRA
jgi:hypothetical protein